MNKNSVVDLAYFFGGLASFIIVTASSTGPPSRYSATAAFWNTQVQDNKLQQTLSSNLSSQSRDKSKNDFEGR